MSTQTIKTLTKIKIVAHAHTAPEHFQRILLKFISLTMHLSNWKGACFVQKLYSSMTQLLSHTIAHFTGSSFMLKANNQPYKKVLALVFSWVNVVKNCKILTFKVNFLRQKLSESFQKKFSLTNFNLGAHFLLLSFFDNFNFFKALHFLIWRSFFDWLYTSVHKT